jgi:hypothetical protein
VSFELASAGFFPWPEGFQGMSDYCAAPGSKLELTAGWKLLKRFDSRSTTSSEVYLPFF